MPVGRSSGADVGCVDSRFAGARPRASGGVSWEALLVSAATSRCNSECRVSEADKRDLTSERSVRICLIASNISRNVSLRDMRSGEGSEAWGRRVSSDVSSEGGNAAAALPATLRDGIPEKTLKNEC